MGAQPRQVVMMESAPSGLSMAERIRSQFVQSPASIAGNLVGMVLITGLYGVSPWLAFAATLWLLRVLHYVRFRLQRSVPLKTLQHWDRSWMVLVILQGSAWGAAVWLFWGEGTAFHQTTLMLMVCTYAIGAVPLLALRPRVFISFCLVIVLPMVLRVELDMANPNRHALAGVLLLLVGLSSMVASSYRKAMVRVIHLKAKSDELSVQLAEQARLAEAAQREAEQANRAKTQFLAAASHDLRQPLHAMGLFAEALRTRVQDAQAAPLIQSINESVQALDELFSQLLDITRIDSGAVQAQFAGVRMSELYARLRPHFEPMAFEKGLVLRWRGAHQVVWADPVLLERILRNLVSNALRYTQDGGVLVACRRSGEEVRLQVWDSGRGMSPAQQARIFDEFYQADPSAPLEPRQAKGMGLGLSIVKRLALLMQRQVVVHSKPGRGSVFELRLPWMSLSPAPSLQPALEEPAPSRPHLQGLPVLVVEDDAAVRQGLQAVLESWGAQVTALGDEAALEAWLQHMPRASALQEPAGLPALLILDHQLSENLTGEQVLRRIRRQWPHRDWPAIVITGSALEDLQARAGRENFQLMIKPVLPGRLLSAIRAAGSGATPAFARLR